MKINQCKRCFSNQLDYSNEQVPYSNKYRTYIRCRKCGLMLGIETPFHQASMEEMVDLWNEINPSSIESVEEGTCENCKHCVKINKNKIYAVCDETGESFKLWDEDIRKKTCKSWQKKNI